MFVRLFRLLMFGLVVFNVCTYYLYVVPYILEGLLFPRDVVGGSFRGVMCRDGN